MESYEAKHVRKECDRDHYICGSSKISIGKLERVEEEGCYEQYGIPFGEKNGERIFSSARFVKKGDYFIDFVQISPHICSGRIYINSEENDPKKFAAEMASRHLRKGFIGEESDLVRGI